MLLIIKSRWTDIETCVNFITASYSLYMAFEDIALQLMLVSNKMLCFGLWVNFIT